MYNNVSKIYIRSHTLSIQYFTWADLFCQSHPIEISSKYFQILDMSSSRCFKFFDVLFT